MKGLPALVILLIILGMGSSSFFTVYETDQAIVLRLGQLVQDDVSVASVEGHAAPKVYKPGLHVKIPFIDSVKKFDTRLNMLDVKSSRIMTSEKKDLLVDFYVQWRINDLALFYTRAQGSTLKAEQLLEQKIIARLKAEFGKRTIQEVVTSERLELMQILKDMTETKNMGVSVVDVRIKRIDLPNEVSSAVYSRMRAERDRVAAETKAQGQAEAITIRAEAEKKKAILLATAERRAEEIRGFGDATAAQIYADTYKKDPEFYVFFRSLEAYLKSFADKNDVLVLKPDTEFFKYFKGNNN